MCVWCGPPIPQACPIRRVALRTGVWGGPPSDTPRLWAWEGERCLPVGALRGGSLVVVSERAFAARAHPLCRARVVLERALGGQVLSISPGAVAPCQPASLLGRGHPDPSGWTIHEGGLARWGARPVESAVLERALALPPGSPAGFCPITPGEFPPVVSARGRALSHPDSFGCSAPMRENDSV